MKKHRKIKKIFNILSIIIYGFTWYNLYKLNFWGRDKNTLDALIVCFITLIIGFVVYISKLLRSRNGVRIINKNEEDIFKSDLFLRNLNISSVKSYGKLKSICPFLAVFVLICTTLFYGGELYGSESRNNRGLSYFFNDILNKKSLEVSNNDISEGGKESESAKINLCENIILSDSSDLNSKVDAESELYKAKNSTDEEMTVDKAAGVNLKYNAGKCEDEDNFATVFVKI